MLRCLHAIDARPPMIMGGLFFIFEAVEDAPQDAEHPLKYRMLVGMVDCVFADVAQPDQARIVSR